MIKIKENKQKNLTNCSPGLPQHEIDTGPSILIGVVAPRRLDLALKKSYNFKPLLCAHVLTLR